MSKETRIRKQRPVTAKLKIAAAFVISAILPELTLAAKFDIEAGVKAATDPLIRVLGEHWGKALFFVFCGGAIAAEGSTFRTKKAGQDEGNKRGKQ